MDVSEFIKGYRNHPVLFIGAGFSRRYCKNSLSWEELLRHLCAELTGHDEFYYDLRDQKECQENGDYLFDVIATKIEEEFTTRLKKDRDGKFRSLNDKFFEVSRMGKSISRMKLYIAEFLKEVSLVDSEKETLELSKLKEAKNNIGTIITTNYDRLIEEVIFPDFVPLIGNHILFNNPYGSIYKIHGCVNDPENIIITRDDYQRFNIKYELIRAQLLSIFMHNPIIFIGYSVSDQNIKNLLQTIFAYVQPNSEEAEKIKRNFLIVERKVGEESTKITEHDIHIQEHALIRVNKVSTDNFFEVYNALTNMVLTISAMEIKKVQSVFKRVQEGEHGTIDIKIAKDFDSLKHGDLVMAIGSPKEVYIVSTVADIVRDYFKIIEEKNKSVAVARELPINSEQYFPVFGFSQILGIDVAESSDDKFVFLQAQQKSVVSKYYSIIDQNQRIKTLHNKINLIISDEGIATTNKEKAIFWSTYNHKLDLEDVKNYLEGHENKKATDYRRLLCLFDILKYAPSSLES